MPARADVDVRFVHALPATGTDALSLVRIGGPGDVSIASARYGKASKYVRLQTGRQAGVSVVLKRDGRRIGKPLRLTRAGRYSVLAVTRPSSMSMNAEPILRAYRDGRAQRGTALLRVVHAASELGAPDLQLDGRVVARKLPYLAATDYLPIAPGRHDVAALKPRVRKPMLARPIRIENNIAATLFVIGSHGAPVRPVLITDDRARRVRSQPGDSGFTMYTVRPGDSLWAIAALQLADEASAAAIANRVVEIWKMNEIRIPQQGSRSHPRWSTPEAPR